MSKTSFRRQKTVDRPAVNISNIEERVNNEAIRKKYGDRLNGRQSATNESSRINYLEVLKVSLPDVAETAFNRSKLFVLGEADSGREELLSALFDIKVEHESLEDVQPVILGRFDAETCKKVETYNSRRITMEVWNYSWKKVYNYLQNLYMTPCTLYLFVFDMKKVLSEDPKVSTPALTYLEDILETKKLHSPTEGVLLVGTNASDLSDKDIETCNQILFERVLRTRPFKVKPKSAQLRFFPVCCDSGEGIEDVKDKLRRTLRNNTPYVTENVPKTVLMAEKLLKETNKPYLKYTEVRRLFVKIGVKDDDFCEVLLQVLTERGIISYFHQYEALKKIIVLSPEWLIRACGVAIYRNGVHKTLDYDIDNDAVVSAFNIFLYQRVMSRDLLFHILGRMGYPAEVHKFVLDLMKSTCMIADYLFDDVDSYLTPTFFPNAQQDNAINEAQYQGPYFMIDFSGHHSQKGFGNNGGVYTCFMPFSFFEKLVSLCIQLSASFGQGIQPLTRYKKARLSFGAEVDFMLSVEGEEGRRPLKIKVSTLTGTSQEKANDLAERLFSMARGIRKDFYPGVAEKSKLVLDLVVPSKDNEPSKLACYKKIQLAREQGTNVIPNYTTPGNVNTAEYNQWLRKGQELKLGNKVSFVPQKIDGILPLPKGKTYHCFLSYKETSALNLVLKQVEDLKRLGYVCWVNKEYQGKLTLDVYTKEVAKSMCFILVLSADVFASPIIIEELKTAIKENVPILFLHHPDTDKLGYWTFNNYITSCPADLRHLFEEIVSIKLETRFYLQEAVTHRLVNKVRDILKEANN